jgi:hypothetical protein
MGWHEVGWYVTPATQVNNHQDIFTIFCKSPKS